MLADRMRVAAGGNGEAPMFVAVGGSGLIMTSEDGINWEIQEGVTTVALNSVAYGDGLYVAVGGSGAGTGTILTSRDGIRWTTRLNNNNLPFVGVCFGNGGWVAYCSATASGQDIGNKQSLDGITWVATNPIITGIHSMQYDTRINKWLRCGNYTNFVYTSDDMVTWIAHNFYNSLGHSESVYRFSYGNGLYITLQINNIHNHKTTDLINWGNAGIGGLSTSDDFEDIQYGNGLWIVGVSNSKLYTSPNGSTWTSRTAVFTNHRRLLYANGMWFMLGSGVNELATSIDGITWTKRTTLATTGVYGIGSKKRYM